MDLNHSPVVHVTPVPSVQIGIRESDPSLVTSSLSLRYMRTPQQLHQMESIGPVDKHIILVSCLSQQRESALQIQSHPMNIIHPWSEQMQSKLYSISKHPHYRYSSVDSHPQVVSQHQQPPGLCPVTYTQMSFPVSPPRPHQIIQSTQTLPSSVQREASQPVPVVLSSQPLESIHVWQAPPAQHTVQSPQMAEAVQFLQTQEAGHTQSYPQSPEQSKGTAVFLSPQFPQYQWKSQVLQPSCTAQEVLHSPKQAQQPELSLCEPEMLMPLEPCQPKLPVPQEPHQPGLTGSQEPYQTELLHPHELDQSEQFHPLESSQSELLPLLTSDQSNLTHPQEPYQSEISQLYNPQVPVVQESQRPLPQEPHLSDLSVPREKSQRRARKHKVCFTCNSHFNQSDSTLRPLFPMVETEHEGIVHYAPSSFPMNKFNSHPKALNNVCTSPYQAVTKGMAVNPTRDTCTQSVVSVLRIEGKQKPEQKKPKRKMSLQKGTSRLKNRRLDTHNTVQKYPTYSQAITDLHMQYTSIAQGGKRQETVSKEEWGAAESKTVLEKEHQIIAGRGMKMAPKEEARVKVEMRGGYTGEGKDYKRPKRAAAVVADVKSLCLVLEERESIVNMRKQIKEKRGWNMEMIKQNQSIVRGCNSNQHMVDRDCSSLPSPGYFSTDQGTIPQTFGCYIQKNVSSKNFAKISADCSYHSHHSTLVNTPFCNSISYCSVLPHHTIIPSQHSTHPSEKSVVSSHLPSYQISPKSSKGDPDHPNLLPLSPCSYYFFPLSHVIHSSIPYSPTITTPCLHPIDIYSHSCPSPSFWQSTLSSHSSGCSTHDPPQQNLTSQNSSFHPIFANLTCPSHPTGVLSTVSSLQSNTISYVSPHQFLPSLSSHLPTVSYMHSTPISSSFLPDGHLHELRNLQITSEDDLCDVKTQQRALECEEQEWKSKEEELLGETDSVVWTLVEEKNGRATTTVMEEGSETMMREILRTMKECQKDKGNRKSMEKGAAVESELIMEDDIIFNVSGKGNKKEEGVKEMEIMKKQMVSLDEDLQDFEMTVGWGKEVSREQLCNLTKESSERGLCFTVQNDNNTDIMKDDSLMEEKLGKCEEQEKPISAKLDVEEGMVRLKRKADKIEESCSGGKRQEDNEMKKYEVHKSQCEIKLKIYGTGMLNQEEAKEAKIRKQKTEIDNQHEKQEIEGEENIEKIGDAKDSREELKKNQEEELLFWPDLWVSESDLVFTEEGLLKLEEDSYIAQIR